MIKYPKLNKWDMLISRSYKEVHILACANKVKRLSLGEACKCLEQGTFVAANYSICCSEEIDSQGILGSEFSNSIWQLEKGFQNQVNRKPMHAMA